MKRKKTDKQARFYSCDMTAAARELRQCETPAEKQLWKLLRNRQFKGLKFRRQHPIGPFITDFYCDELKLILEIDEGVHDEVSVQVRDRKRTETLQSSGYRVHRIRNEEVLSDASSLFQYLESLVNL